MPGYLDYTFTDSPAFVDTFDEMPLWSAAFGLLMLRHLELKRDMHVLDIGSGTGFPLVELASRLGDSCKCYGLDPWTNANERARKKINNYGLENVTIIEGGGENIPLQDNSLDLVVSNLGINNFPNRDKVFAECNRVLKPGGRLVITTNLNGHWSLFYEMFRQALQQLNKTEFIRALNENEEHRGTMDSISALFTNNGFKVSKHFLDQTEMRFVDGSAFLNHYFVKLGWLSDWKSLIPADEQKAVFTQLEENMNRYATENGGLNLLVPMAYIEGRKQ